MKMLCYFKERLARGHECLLGEPTEAQLEQLARCVFDVIEVTPSPEPPRKPAPVANGSWSQLRKAWVEFVRGWLRGEAAEGPAFIEARRAVMALAEQEVGPLVPHLTDTYDKVLPEEAAKEFVEEWEDDTDRPVLVVVRPLDDEARALDCWQGDTKRPFVVIRAEAHVEVTWSTREAEGEEASLP
jgi:hypothetical protein